MSTPTGGPAGTRRVAIVTGGARGIGASVVARLVADGLAVAVLDLDGGAAEAAAAAQDGDAIGLAVDVTQRDQVEAAVAQVASALGPPTVLVSNAGITRDNLLFKTSDEDWDAVIGVHLRGAFLTTRAVQQHMVAERWGRLVTISSTSALGNRGQVNYSTAKAGLQGFTKTVALELGRYGVTANVVAPGFVESEMTRATAERLGQDWDAYREARAAAIPVQRTGTGEDIAHAVSFFVSEGAGYVSGQVLYVAGGPKA